MNSYNSKDKFILIKQNSHYLRVDEFHPLDLLIGVNDYGQKTIRFVGQFQKAKVKSTKTIEVNHYSYRDKIIISFSLIDDSFVDLFYLFCNDLIDSSRNISQENGYTYIVNRYERWRNFSGITRRFLSENEIKGLIGELFFLKEILFNKYGVSKAISGWTGTEPLKKDFSFDSTWYEIKTVTGNSIHISSTDQLDSVNKGYLIVYSLEKLSSEAEGLSLPGLYNEIMSMLELDTDKHELIIRLVQANFFNEEYYSQFVYELTEQQYFLVDEHFPKIRKDQIDNAITNVKYELLVSMLDSFKVDEL